LRDSRFSRHALEREGRHLLARIDPYHRLRFAPSRRRSSDTGGIWFYSTARTYTSIGLLYEPYFPAALRFLVEDAATGGAALADIGRTYATIYDFAAPDMIPTSAEIAEAGQVIRQHIAMPALEEEERLARDLLLESQFLSTFMSRHLTDGLYQTCLFEAWADRVRPAALVVGNPVFEGYALHAARKRGIPTILLQHGILGDYTQLSDPPVDHYVVRGAFWRQFLSASAGARARVLNPPRPGKSAPASPARRAILFLTAPHAFEGFWHQSDITDILKALLRSAATEASELIIRVHPREQIGFYEAHVRRLLAGESRPPAVSYSQSTPIEPVLQRSAVAVTYFSTAFLDCLRHHVPVVSFGWHDFPFKRQLERHGVFHFASSIAELSRYAARAVRGQLPAFAGDAEPFLATMGEEELRRGLAGLVSGAQAARRTVGA
jgi:hypothetical protein